MTRSTSSGLCAAAVVLLAVNLAAATAEAPVADAMEKMDGAAVRTLLQAPDGRDSGHGSES